MKKKNIECEEESKYKTKEDYLLEYGPEFGPMLFEKQEKERIENAIKPRTWVDTIIDISIVVTFILVVYTMYSAYSENKEEFITDSDYLYDVAVDYLTYFQKYNAPELPGYTYRTFADYVELGITDCVTGEERNQLVVYAWVVYEGCYEKNGVFAVEDYHEGAYRFIIENRNKVIHIQQPYKGDTYNMSVRQLFPKKLEDEVIGYEMVKTNFVMNQIETSKIMQKEIELGIIEKQE